jgi:hypothetical protein
MTDISLGEQTAAPTDAGKPSFTAQTPSHVARNENAGSKSPGMRDWPVPGEVPPVTPPRAAGNSRPTPKAFNPGGKS